MGTAIARHAQRVPGEADHDGGARSIHGVQLPVGEVRHATQRCQFSSAILPAWARRSAQSAALDTQQGGQASRTAADTRRRSNPHEVSTVSMDCYVAWPFAE